MGEIIHKETGYSIHFHILYDGGFGHMAHVVVLVTEFQGDEGVETTRPVLQVAKTLHMIDAVGIAFDMSIEHGRIGMHSFPVCCLMDMQPAFGVYFVRTDHGPDVRVEDLGAS